MDTESKFKSFSRLYVRNNFQTGLTVDTGAAKLSPSYLGGGGAVPYLIALSLSHHQSSTSLSPSSSLMLFLLYYGWQNISRYFFYWSSANLELSTFFDFHRIPQTGNNVMVACSLRCKATHVLFTMTYRFVVPVVCTCLLVRPSGMYASLLRN